MAKKLQKFKKLQVLYKKYKKVRDVKILQEIPLLLNYTVTNFETIEEVPWLLRQKKPKKTTKIF